MLSFVRTKPKHTDWSRAYTSCVTSMTKKFKPDNQCSRILILVSWENFIFLWGWQEVWNPTETCYWIAHLMNYSQFYCSTCPISSWNFLTYQKKKFLVKLERKFHTLKTLHSWLWANTELCLDLAEGVGQSHRMDK